MDIQLLTKQAFCQILTSMAVQLIRHCYDVDEILEFYWETAQLSDGLCSSGGKAIGV